MSPINQDFQPSPSLQDRAVCLMTLEAWVGAEVRITAGGETRRKRNGR